MVLIHALYVFIHLVAFVSAQCWQNVTCNGPSVAAFSGSWTSNIYAPASRSISPASILTWPELRSHKYPSSHQLSGNGSLVTYDFGKEVGGIVTVSYHAKGQGQLGLAFTEAKDFVGEWSDSSNGKFAGPDGALYTNITSGTATYVMPQERLRGGFRYMTVFLLTNSSAHVMPEEISVELDFQPTWPNLQAYQGYFHSNDELLNKIWYAGAYTLQSNAVPTSTGRQVPFLTTGWANNATLGPGDTIIVDGAKRDRAVWPGDMGVAVPSTFFSLGDLTPVKNALQVMYNYQDSTTGAFDESGPPLSQTGSDTYHMWTMIGTYNYFLYTNDTAFLLQNWAGYQHAMSFILGKMDSTGLLNVTGTRDWARWWQGNHNTEANVILYHTLITGSSLATWLSDYNLAANWTITAATLSTNINTQCYDQAAGAYKDNNTATYLHPQDANALSLYFNVASDSQAPRIATELTNNWTPIGPVAPELPYNISPFITSFELLGRLTIRDTTRALALLRTTWGWIINNKNSTESTFLEGYLYNGSFSYRSDRGYDYDASYPSHAHGWSTGPTSALTTRILGLDIIEPLGASWSLAPQFGDLKHVEGGFVTGLGKYSARWTKDAARGVVEISWNTPAATEGTILLPWKGSWKGWIGNMAVSGKGQAVAAWEGISVQGAEYSISAFGERLVRFRVKGAGSVTVPL